MTNLKDLDWDDSADLLIVSALERLIGPRYSAS